MNSCFSFSPRSLTMSPNVAKLTQQQANKRWWRRKNRRQQNRVWSNRRRSEISRSIYSFSSSIISQYFSLSIEFYKRSPIALLRMTAKTNKLKNVRQKRWKKNFCRKQNDFYFFDIIFAKLVCLQTIFKQLKLISFEKQVNLLFRFIISFFSDSFSIGVRITVPALLFIWRCVWNFCTLYCIWVHWIVKEKGIEEFMP